MREEVAQNWLDQCTVMRQAGRFDAARVALRNAELAGLGRDTPGKALLEECRIYKESGQVFRALKLLEPVELDTTELLHDTKIKCSSNIGRLSENLRGDAEVCVSACVCAVCDRGTGVSVSL